MSFIFLQIGTILLSVSVLNHVEPTTPKPSTRFLVPIFATPLPPIGTRCYTFDTYLKDDILTSLHIEDFTLVRNTAIIRPTKNCVSGNGNDNSIQNAQSSFCAETETKLNSERMCNANHRSSVIICRKWWGERHQESGNNTFSNNPPDSKSIEAICILFPTKPWCDPREVCGWYPTLPQCPKANSQIVTTFSAVHGDVWYIAGILRDNNFRGQGQIACDPSEVMPGSHDLFQRVALPKK